MANQLTEKYLVVGTLVKCVYPNHSQFGNVGSISKVIRNNPDRLGEYCFDVDFVGRGSVGNWARLDSFELWYPNVGVVAGDLSGEYPVKTTTFSKSAKVPEKPCKVCTRPNDVGVSKCWHCECSHPC